MPPSSRTGTDAPKLLYLVTEDWYFWSHRLPMARAARAAGFAVGVATRVDGHGERIRAEGFTLHPLAWRRGRAGLWPSLLAIREIVRVYRAERPDLVHHVALKSVILGSIAARCAGIPVVVNALTGLGTVFSSPILRMRLLRTLLLPLLRRLLGHRTSHVLLQNDDDRALLIERRLARPERIRVVPGSGVDCRRFPALPPPAGRLVAALVGRMVWDKGVGEAVAAARLLRERGVPLTIALVGSPDPENPRSIPEALLREWQQEGLVEWWGQREDMVEVWRQAAIALLPSYREGMPKALLEAAACARPLIATDVPGCRSLVRPGSNGILVPPRDAAALADALQRMAGDPELRRAMGEASRALVAATHSEERIGTEIVDFYQILLGRRPAG